MACQQIDEVLNLLISLHLFTLYLPKIIIKEIRLNLFKLKYIKEKGPQKIKERW